MKVIIKKFLNYNTELDICIHNSNYKDLFLKGDHLIMSVHLMHTIAIEVYKCINGIAPKYLQDLFIKQNHRYGMRNSSNVMLNRFQTVKYGYSSFKYLGAKIWNNLPNEVKNAMDVNTFKHELKSYKNCNCLIRGLS